jgi:hypothetical protein
MNRLTDGLGFTVSSTKIALRKNPWRVKHRFLIEQRVCYQCVRGRRLSPVGVGKTIEISSQEICFTTQDPIETGANVRLAVDWPAMLDNTCRMTLGICGSVIRSAPGRAVIKIARYEFRTRARPAKPNNGREIGQAHLTDALSSSLPYWLATR